MRRDIPEMLSARKVAERLGRSTRWVKDAAKRGLFRAYQDSGGFLVEVESVNRYLESCRVVPRN